LTKGEIRNKLKAVFGTDKTATVKDDDILYTFMGQTLKKLTSIGIIYSKDGKYYLSEHALAKANDINEIMTLRADFISTLHSRGGEFFEKYFMELLSQYLKKRGYEVLECYVNGGSDDGGIDGVIKTKDALGFKETTMVQTKNRNDIVSETAVRGFYGAVCASRGTRGIFACVSDFHSSAQKFLDGLDDCIGVNGTVLFKMACECLYGIKKTKDGLSVDQRIFNRG
jgi:restriction endonuclease Mrr